MKEKSKFKKGCFLVFLFLLLLATPVLGTVSPDLPSSPITFNFEQETIASVEEGFSIYADKECTVKIELGEKISSYIGGVLYSKKDEVIRSHMVPGRLAAMNPEINFLEETTLKEIPDTYIYSNKSDMSEAIQGKNEKIPLIPGTNLYIKRLADSKNFASEIYRLVIPPRPPAPFLPTVKEMNETQVILVELVGGAYRIKTGDWQESPVFLGLKSGTAYVFEQRLLATETSFASKISTATIKILKTPIAQEPFEDKIIKPRAFDHLNELNKSSSFSPLSTSSVTRADSKLSSSSVDSDEFGTEQGTSDDSTDFLTADLDSGVPPYAFETSEDVSYNRSDVFGLSDGEADSVMGIDEKTGKIESIDDFILAFGGFFFLAFMAILVIYRQNQLSDKEEE